ncbi:unnamed protein product, partial [Prorocentrum cordatum]
EVPCKDDRFMGDVDHQRMQDRKPAWITVKAFASALGRAQNTPDAPGEWCFAFFYSKVCRVNN